VRGGHPRLPRLPPVHKDVHRPHNTLWPTPHLCHSRESGNPSGSSPSFWRKPESSLLIRNWIPAFAGMTKYIAIRITYRRLFSKRGLGGAGYSCRSKPQWFRHRAEREEHRVALPSFPRKRGGRPLLRASRVAASQACCPTNAPTPSFPRKRESIRFFSVILAKARIQSFNPELDPGFRRDDARSRLQDNISPFVWQEGPVKTVRWYKQQSQAVYGLTIDTLNSIFV